MYLDLVINIHSLLFKYLQKENYIIHQFPLSVNSDEESKHACFIKCRFLRSQSLMASLSLKYLSSWPGPGIRYVAVTNGPALGPIIICT